MKTKILSILFALVLIYAGYRMFEMVQQKGENFNLQVVTIHGLFEPTGICQEPRELCLESIETALMVLEKNNQEKNGLQNHSEEEDLGMSESEVFPEEMTEKISEESEESADEETLNDSSENGLGEEEIVEDDKEAKTEKALQSPAFAPGLATLLLGAGIQLPPQEFPYDAVYLPSGELLVSDPLKENLDNQVVVIQLKNKNKNEEVGIIGARWDHPEDIQDIQPKGDPRVLALEEKVKERVQKLVDRGVNKIILIGQIPLQAARRLAHEVFELDIIVAGGLQDHAEESYPLAITNRSKKSTLIFYRNYKTDPMIGMTDILFNGHGFIVGWKTKTHRLIAE